MNQATALAISPHLDDAAFSAGGTLAALARGGWRVTIATVFTASVPAPRGFALACQLDKGLSANLDYMELRRAEDALACRHLGAVARWLPFCEAPHRGYHSAHALFSGLHDHDGVVDEIVPALGALIEEQQPRLILAPQAIGGHVDHVAVVLALLALGDLPILWWRDFPYTLRGGGRAETFPFFEGLAKMRRQLDADERTIKADAAAAHASQLGFQFGGEHELRLRLAEAGEEESFRATETVLRDLRGHGFEGLATLP